MPRLFHRPPKYRRHKTSAIVSLFGKRIHLGPYGSQKSHERYQELLKEWEETRHASAQRRKESGSTDAKTVAASVTEEHLRQKCKSGVPVVMNELILVYRRHTHEYYRKHGEVTREAGAIDDALRILRKHHGMTVVSDFGPVSLNKLREAMIDELDWSRKYINKQVNRIRAMFKWAASKEIVAPSVSAALRELVGLKNGRTRARETPRVQPVPDSVIDATLMHLPQVVGDMARIQRLTSARPGEICSMCPGDIDRSEDVWVYRPAEHKTEHFEKDRVIAIGPRAQEVLAGYMSKDSKMYCFSPSDSERIRRAKLTESRCTPTSCGNGPGTNQVAIRRRPAGERYTTGSYRRSIHRVCDKHGIEKWSPNRIRHTASTEIRKLFGIEAARAVDGHGSAGTTEIYAELDLGKAIEVMREVG